MFTGELKTHEVWRKILTEMYASLNAQRREAARGSYSVAASEQATLEKRILTLLKDHTMEMVQLGVTHGRENKEIH